MRLNGHDLPRKLQFPLLIACATYPLAALLSLWTAREVLKLALVFPAAYFPLAMVCLVLPGRVRLAGGIAGCLALLGLGAALPPIRGNAAMWLLPVGYAAVLMQGLSMAAWPKDRELHLAWPILGVTAHVLAQVLLNTADANMGMPATHAEWLSVAPELFGTFLLLLILALLAANRSSVLSASMGRQRVPAGMRRWNTLLTVGLLVLVLLIAAVPGIARALAALWDALRTGVGMVFRLLTSLFPHGGDTVSRQEGGTPELFGMMEEAAEPSLWAVILERVMLALAVVMLAALAVLAARFLYRRVRVLARRLFDRLIRFAAAAGEDYVDEVSDTRDEEGAERLSLRGRFRQRVSLNRGNLPPRERIRYRYLRLRHRHPEWRASQTAREAIPDGAAELYERARYSDHEITEADARAFEEGVRKI